MRWVIALLGLNAFFLAIIALDPYRHYLTAIEIQEIEGKRLDWIERVGPPKGEETKEYKDFESMQERQRDRVFRAKLHFQFVSRFLP